MEKRPARSSSRRLTPDEVERIVELRTTGTPVRRTAELVDTSTKTVQAVWKRHLASVAKEHAEQTEMLRAAVAVRLTRIADDAQRDKDRASELRAIAQMSKLLGLDAPAKVEHSGEVGFTVIQLGEEVDDTPAGADAVDVEFEAGDDGEL